MLSKEFYFGGDGESWPNAPFGVHKAEPLTKGTQCSRVPLGAVVSAHC